MSFDQNIYDKLKKDEILKRRILVMPKCKM